MHTTNYFETFIEAAEDCQVERAVIPSSKNGEKTIAVLHYELLMDHPYQYTSDEVIFNTFVQKNNIEVDQLETEREKFFSKGQACLRSSPLTKRYGWGVHSDRDGKVAIFAIESVEYKKYRSDRSVKHLKGMRTTRK